MELRVITESIRRDWVNSLKPGDLLVSMADKGRCRRVGDIIKVLANRDDNILYENVDGENRGNTASFRKSINAINKVTVKAFT